MNTDKLIKAMGAIMRKTDRCAQRLLTKALVVPLMLRNVCRMATKMTKAMLK